MTNPHVNMDDHLDVDSIIAFLEEAISFVVMHKNLSWEPPVNIFQLIPITVPLFTQSIGEAITDHCMEDLFSRLEPERFLLPRDVNATCIQNYLRIWMDSIPHDSYRTYFYFVSFVCHFCAKAIRLKRSVIIAHILMEAVLLLYSRCNSLTHFINLIQAALDNSSQQRAEQTEREDFK
ncbi:uncharacterized protein TNCV_402051 [Trichonephila clavipes]|nr:uncharacterized protein TNCV_402051 [Trichonephila clavipes]